MTETVIVVSPDGDVPLPPDIRDELRWEAGTRLVIERTASGVLLRPEDSQVLFPPTRHEDVRGMLKYDGPPATVEDMDLAIEGEMRRAHDRGRY